MDKWLNHPTAIKLMALTIGIIMWAVVHFDPAESPSNVASLTEIKTIDGVQVEPVGLDERNFVLRDIEPETVKLTVRGVRGDMRRAAKEDYRLEVDLRDVTEGTHTLPVRVARLPRGMEFVEFSTGSVTVTVEALQTKEFQVEITTEGTPAEGYIAGTPIVRPTNRVHVTLPRNTLAQVSKVGAVIPVDGETDTIKNKAVKLAAFDEYGQVIEGAFIDPAVVEVEVPITNPFKTVPLQIVMIGEMPAGLSISSFEPDAEQVTVYGPKEALDQIDFIEADLQLAELTKSGKVTISLVAAAPVTEISPAQITVNVEVVLADTRTLEGLPINWRGLGEGLKVKIVEPATGKADITVKGSPARLGRLQPGDITVDADLTGKGPGTHTVHLIVNSPRFIEQSGGTSEVTLEIEADVPAAAESAPPSDAAESPGVTESQAPAESPGVTESQAPAESPGVTESHAPAESTEPVTGNP